MGCEGCTNDLANGARERDRAAVTQKARSYAKEKKVEVYLYFDPAGGWQFCEGNAAGGKPIVELIPIPGDTFG